MKLNETYDIICTGSSLGSLLTAALAAKDGKSVLLVSENDIEKEAIDTFSDRIFDVHGEVFSKIFNKLHSSLSVKKFYKMKDELQLIFQKQRLLWADDSEKFLKECYREVPEDYASIEKLMRKMIAIEFIHEDILSMKSSAAMDKAKLSNAKSLASEIISNLDVEGNLKASQEFLPNQHALMFFIRALLSALSNGVSTNLSTAHLMSSLMLFSKPVFKYQGGMHLLKLELLKILRVHGGDIKNGTSTESIICENNNIKGILLNAFEGVIECKSLIIGHEHRKLYSTLPEAMQSQTIRDSLNRVKATHRRLSIEYTIPKNKVAIGTTGTMVVIPDYERDFDCENMFLITLNDSNEESGTSTKACNITITTILENKSSQLEVAHLRKIAYESIGMLQELYPFLEADEIKMNGKNHHEFIESDEFKKKYFKINIPESFLRYSVSGKKLVQGVKGLDIKTNISNLFFIGKSIWPSLGSYGEAVCAWDVFESVTLFLKNELTKGQL